MSRALCVVAGAALGAGTVVAWQKFKPLIGFGLGALANLGSGVSGDVGVHLRQIRRYAFAASQDKSPVVGLTHASYALVLLDTLEEMIGRDAVARAGYDPKKVRDFITKLQDTHAEKLRACDPHLTEILRIERAEGMQLPGFVVAGAAPRGA